MAPTEERENEMTSAFDGTSSAAPHVAIIGTRGYPSHYGGFETAVRHLAPYLCDSGWRVTVYGRSGLTGPGDPRVESRTTAGIDRRSLSTLSYGLSSVIDSCVVRPDVALVMNVANGFWLPLLRARRIPTLVNVDGLEWTRDKWGALAKGMFLAGAKATAKFADRLVFDSTAIGEYWAQNFGADGDFIPYGGTPLAAVAPKEFDRPYVLMVARFVPENTVPQFLDAVPHIDRDLDVVIVGSEGYGGALDAAAAQLSGRDPRVHWLGHVRDDVRLLSLWNHAEVYFHGHTVGGTNPALVQAATLGVPTVARDTVFNREVLEEGGFYVDGSPTEIARAINQLHVNPKLRRDKGEIARSRAQEQYTWDGVCGRYESALAELVGRQRERRNGTPSKRPGWQS